MYFFIASIACKILFWLYVGIVVHLGIKAVGAATSGKFELPFYLKRFYPPFLKFLNDQNGYYDNDIKPDSLEGYMKFLGVVLAYMFISSLLNFVLFPIVMTVTVGYLIISYQLEYGGKVESTKEDKSN